MTRQSHRNRTAFLTATLAGAFLIVPLAAAGTGTASGKASQEISSGSEAAAKLNKSQFKDVKVTVENGIATLTGTVSLYDHKADAGKRVLKAKGVTAVRNLITVAGPSIADRELENKLRERLAYDRVGWGNEFDAIGVTVENGVVTVSGNAHTPVNRDSALALIATTPGVKDLTGDIEVDPTSPMDDQIRIATARAIYDYPSLNKYFNDPAKPIRISVKSGNVELYGTVNTVGDRQIAEMRAKSVPGVFSVKNYLQVPGQSAETGK